MKCRYFCRLPLDISPVYLTRGISIQVKYLEISVETVAEEYGLTKSGVNNRIYKAKRWLQEEFRKVYE